MGRIPLADSPTMFALEMSATLEFQLHIPFCADDGTPEKMFEYESYPLDTFADPIDLVWLYASPEYARLSTLSWAMFEKFRITTSVEATEYGLQLTTALRLAIDCSGTLLTWQPSPPMSGACWIGVMYS